MAEEEKSFFIHEIIDADLKEGRVDHVHTRFPPEPNGYLHLGSAKAIYINAYTARKYGGLFNLRYDDTNPKKEDDEFVQSILEDLIWLGAEPTGGVFYGSDYFEQCYQFALKLIRQGDAFVCDYSADEVRATRGTLTEPGQNSPYRERSVEENLNLFERMRAGEFDDGACTLRAKIDMASPNLNLRDPVIYRIVKEPKHHRQQDRFCIYPMYDFAHPIQDALEGITHSLCSIEFENHRPLYDWVVDHVGFEQKPHQYEFARMNVTYTVMSKRYLRALVESGSVDGWDDPRMPTICALRRRGYPASAINEFVRRAGVAKSYNNVEIELLEHCVREELNESALRKVAVLEPVELIVENYPEEKTEYFELPNHPGDPAKGTRKVPFSKRLYVEKSDFRPEAEPKFFRLFPGNEVRLMGAYVLRCTHFDTNEDGSVKRIYGTIDVETAGKNPADGRKIKGTIHWLSAKEAVPFCAVMYDRLFTRENMSSLPENTDCLDFLAPNSRTLLEGAVGEASLAETKPGDVFQFVRTGYFCKDSKCANTFHTVVALKDSKGK